MRARSITLASARQTKLSNDSHEQSESPRLNGVFDLMTSLIPRNCPVCDSGDAQMYRQKGELRLVRCSQCSMIYANPVPAEFASGDFYNHVGAEYYLSPAK